MKWLELSNESKSILKWLESPVSDELLVLHIRKNKVWKKHNIEIYVSDNIFNEISEYISIDNDVEILVKNESILRFKLV